MTIKEISEMTKASEKTIREKIKKNFPGLMKKGKRTVLNKEKVDILFRELKTVGIISEVGKSSEDIGKTSDVLILAQSINNLAAGLMAQVNQNKRIEALESKFQARVDALPAPAISPRQEINRIVRDYAENTDMTYRDVWHMLYKDFDYRMNRNFSLCAKNRALPVIDYIEKEGLIEELLATAREVLK